MERRGITLGPKKLTTSLQSMSFHSDLAADGRPKLDPAFIAETRAPYLLTTQGIMFGLASAAVLLRVYVRMFMLSGLGVDDYVMLVAALCSVATLTTFVGETQNGLGRHFAAVMLEPDLMKPFGQYMFFNSIFLSRWRKFIIFMIGFLVLFTLACLGTLIFQCLPVSAAWDYGLRDNGKTKCLTPNTYLHIGIFNSSINIATDIIFATIPIPMFFRIQVKMRRKVILIGILGLGYFACAAAVAKLVLQIGVNQNEDSTWDADYYIWNGVEFYVGIITACLPTLRPLFKSLLDSSKTLTGRRSRSRQTNGYYVHNDSSHPLGSYNSKNTRAVRDKYDVQVSSNRDRLDSNNRGSDNDWGRGYSPDEYILSKSNGEKGSTRIVRTTEISVLSDLPSHNHSPRSDGTLRLAPQHRTMDQF
ncbi:hypothetical protein FQN53_002629 [Emmonsiellopsis sp. PD_33]|nr:hypothetical protein FQN53_002629 [Emmonsiellopsis sp. PD_33]